jgi:transcriptional regulator with XRE-family HTH domain
MKTTFQSKLKEIRTSKGLCQKQVGRALGVKQSTVCGWETGRREPTIRQLQQFAELCEVPLCQLFHGTSAASSECGAECENQVGLSTTRGAA